MLELLTVLVTVALVQVPLGYQVSMDFEEGLRRTVACTRLTWQEMGDAV